jgi:hypothetical protein
MISFIPAIGDWHRLLGDCYAQAYMQGVMLNREATCDSAFNRTFVQRLDTKGCLDKQANQSNGSVNLQRIEKTRINLLTIDLDSGPQSIFTIHF